MVDHSCYNNIREQFISLNRYTPNLYESAENAAANTFPFVHLAIPLIPHFLYLDSDIFADGKKVIKIRFTMLIITRFLSIAIATS